MNVHVGSIDGPAAVGAIPQVALPNGMAVPSGLLVTGVAVMEVPLADALASDLVVSIPGQEGSDCGFSGPAGVGALGLLIDDLRAE